MISFKDGVKLGGLQPQMLVALQVVRDHFDRYQLPTVVTSVNDGVHMEGSKHYGGAAMDFRTKHAAGIAKGIVQGLAAALNPLGFDVIWEGAGRENEHLHVEYDPK